MADLPLEPLTPDEAIKLLREAAEHQTKACPQYRERTLFWRAAECIAELQAQGSASHD
ncbi:hypothetical protein ACHMW5_13610 [Azospirillum melinis]|uniref:hypothetical protein n=1 Tax=Azospirillum melinis TaxID=328839 RepID=UPI0037571076